MPKLRVSIEGRFWANIQKTDTCWLWIGTIKDNGYGTLGIGGRGCNKITAHRLSWELHFGPIPKGKYVCHSCDNRVCVNPSHFFLGDASSNAIDMRSKHRCPTKLTVDQVRVLRTGIGSQRALAEKYGVSPTLVGKIRRNESWAWLC